MQTSKVSDVPSLSQETGFWFVLHHVPTGPSAGMYSPGYSEHMPMGKFSNNRAHSNYRVSLHATGALPSEQTPSPRSSSLGLRAISACAFCFTRELLHACLCLQIRQLAGWRGSARSLPAPAPLWLLGIQSGSPLCSGCFPASVLPKYCLQEHPLAACLIIHLHCQCWQLTERLLEG